MSTQDKTEREALPIPDITPGGLTSNVTYFAYMLRLWRAGSRGGQPVWRASLENPHTGERLAFATVANLFVFLTEKIGACVETPGVSDETTSTSNRKITPVQGFEC